MINSQTNTEKTQSTKCTENSAMYCNVNPTQTTLNSSSLISSYAGLIHVKK